MPTIQRLNTADADFWPRLEALTAWEGVADEAVQQLQSDDGEVLNFVDDDRAVVGHGVGAA